MQRPCFHPRRQHTEQSGRAADQQRSFDPAHRQDTGQQSQGAGPGDRRTGHRVSGPGQPCGNHRQQGRCPYQRDQPGQRRTRQPGE
nr:hypothetical protein [Pseudomonas aeruginosa]